MFQMRKQDKTPEEQLSEVEIGNLPEKEFRVMTVQMMKELGKRMDAQSKKSEVFNKELKNIKNNQTEMQNMINEMKNTLEGINIRLNDTEEQISDLQSTGKHCYGKEKRMKRNQDSLRALQDSIKHTNMHTVGVPQGRRGGGDRERRERERERERQKERERQRERDGKQNR